MMVTENPLYLTVTSEFLQGLGRSLPKWHPPWAMCRNDEYSHGGWPHRGSGAAIRGDNMARLWKAARVAGYVRPIWLTESEIVEAGGSLVAGAGGVMVRVAYGADGVAIDAGARQAGTIDPRQFRDEVIYNVAQTDGLPDRYRRGAWELMPRNEERRIPQVEGFFRDLGLDPVHRVDPEIGARAGLEMVTVRVHMPPWQLFDSAWDYYVTLAHEAVHWARFDQGRFNQAVLGDDVLYAREDMIAEVGAAFLCVDLGFSSKRVCGQVPYLRDALSTLGSGREAVLVAAEEAAETVEWLHQRAPGHRAGQGEGYRQGDRSGGADDDRRVFAATRDARLWVQAAAAACRSHSERNSAWIRDAVRVLDGANRIDLDTESVRVAIEAAVILSFPGRRGEAAKPENYIEEVRRALTYDIEQAVADVRREWRGPAPSTGMRY